MPNTSGKRSPRKRGEKKTGAPVKVTTNYGTANEPPKVENPFAILTPTEKCRKADCQIRMSPWSGLERWVCATCGFETFDAAEMKARLKKT